MGKLLTIGVPAYNVEDYLEQSLDSYADQRFFGSLEVIVVNDGSSDRTSEIAHAYAQRWPQVFRGIEKQNGGHGSAVNAALDAAEGRYYRVVDGDDWMLTDNLARLLDCLAYCTSDLVVDVKREVHSVTGETVLDALPVDVETGHELPFEQIAKRSELYANLMIHDISVRVDFARSHDVRLLEKCFYVDYEYVLKLTVPARTITFFNLETYQYRVGNVSQSISSANYVKRYENHDRVVREVLRFADACRNDPHLEETAVAYAQQRAVYILYTHFNIALIFDRNRKRGRQRARATRRMLRSEYPYFWPLVRKRYLQAYVLGLLGFDAARLDRLMGHARRDA